MLLIELDKKKLNLHFLMQTIYFKYLFNLLNKFRNKLLNFIIKNE